MGVPPPAITMPSTRDMRPPDGRSIDQTAWLRNPFNPSPPRSGQLSRHPYSTTTLISGSTKLQLKGA